MQRFEQYVGCYIIVSKVDHEIDLYGNCMLLCEIELWFWNVGIILEYKCGS